MTKMITVRVPEDWHIALKQAALDRRTTVTQIVIDAVNKYLEEDDTTMTDYSWTLDRFEAAPVHTEVAIVGANAYGTDLLSRLYVKGDLDLSDGIAVAKQAGYYPILDRDGGCCEATDVGHGADARTVISITVLYPGDVRMVSVDGSMTPVTHDTCTDIVEVWLPDGKISLRVAHDEDPDVTLDGSAACHYLRYEDGEASEYTIYYPEIAEHKDDEYGDWEHYYSIEGWYVRHSSWDPQ